MSFVRWYNSVDGSDFFSFLSSHCPHLSADVAKDFSSGSSVLLSTLWSSTSLPSDRPASTLGSLPSSSLFSSAVPALTPSSVLLKGFAVALDAPVSSTAFLSSLPSGLASLVAPPPLLAQSLSSSSLLPPSLSRAGVPVGFGTVVGPGPSAPPQYAPPVSSSSLFRPFDASSAGPSGVFSSSTSLPLHGLSPVFASTPPSGIPPPPVAPLGSSFSSAAPGPSFAPPQPGPEVPDDASFDPVFADPSALGPEPPLAPSVPHSVRAEIRRMYAYIVFQEYEEPVYSYSTLSRYAISPRYPNILKMSPPFASSEGVGSDRYQGDSAHETQPTRHCLFQEYEEPVYSYGTLSR